MNRLIYTIVIIILFSCTGKTKNNKNIGDIEIDSLNVIIKSPKIYNLSDSIEYSDFNIIIESNYNLDCFTSVDSSYSREYFNETRKIKVFLTSIEKFKIWEIVREYDFFDLPNKIVEDDKGFCIAPASSTKITIIIGQNKKSVYYAGSCDIKDKKIGFRFGRICRVINEIIYDKMEVKQLKKSDIPIL